jgi:hypothetical protein
VALALLASSGKASEVFKEYYSRGRYYSHFYDYRGEIKTASEYLEMYTTRLENSPPIDAVLDVLATNPKWNDYNNVQSMYQGSGDDEAKARWVKEQYFVLFRKIARTLRALAASKARELEKKPLKASMIPEPFTQEGNTVDEGVPVPMQVAVWIAAERERGDFDKQRDKFNNTVLLLIVLGAFGSLIFLVREYIEKNEKTGLAGYVFRPILGMFLAIAMFLVDVVAHSVLSSASILEIRHETLWILALAAGLLSEQAYQWVVERAAQAIKEGEQKARQVESV